MSNAQNDVIAENLEEMKEEKCTPEKCLQGHMCQSGCEKDFDCPCLSSHPRTDIDDTSIVNFLGSPKRWNSKLEAPVLEDTKFVQGAGIVRTIIH